MIGQPDLLNRRPGGPKAMTSAVAARISQVAVTTPAPPAPLPCHCRSSYIARAYGSACLVSEERQRVLFVRLFVRLFVCSFVRSFVRLFVCLFGGHPTGRAQPNSQGKDPRHDGKPPTFGGRLEFAAELRPPPGFAGAAILDDEGDLVGLQSSDAAGMLVNAVLDHLHHRAFPPPPPPPPPPPMPPRSSP